MGIDTSTTKRDTTRRSSSVRRYTCEELTPAACKILEVARKRDRDWSFCFKDFEHLMAHQTFLNNISKLKKLGLVRRIANSNPAFYALNHDSIKDSSSKDPIVVKEGRKGVPRRVYIDMDSFLDSLDWTDFMVHDIRLLFFSSDLFGSVPLAEVEDGTHWKQVERSKDRVKHMVIGDFNVYVACHKTGNVSVVVECADRPFEVSVKGLTLLAAVLGQIRERLLQHGEVPAVTDWVVVQWHYGADTKRVVRGRDFEVSFLMWTNQIGRYYTRKSGKIRKEVVESPKKTLPETFGGTTFDKFNERLEVLTQGQAMLNHKLEKYVAGVVSTMDMIERRTKKEFDLRERLEKVEKHVHGNIGTSPPQPKFFSRALLRKPNPLLNPVTQPKIFLRSLLRKPVS